MDPLLTKLMADADWAVDQARKVKGVFGEAINWGDLCCRSVGNMTDCGGHEWRVVVIEEAAPECKVFHAFIRLRLEERGWEGIEVRTEW